MAYLEPCVTLAYLEPSYIHNVSISTILAYLGPEVYLESCLFRHIQAYSSIFKNDSYNNINLLFFTLILAFQRDLERHMLFDYSVVHFNARLSLLK